ncbi:hypothetical protein O3P69_000614 [Scylla paramamosain]|uniref:Uncharacterized protein n=1 Tax=Scylla paramamosain TaxID=85552 RepID=A0AAW0UQ91_SCYPA
MENLTCPRVLNYSRPAPFLPSPSPTLITHRTLGVCPLFPYVAGDRRHQQKGPVTVRHSTAACRLNPTPVLEKQRLCCESCLTCRLRGTHLTHDSVRRQKMSVTHNQEAATIPLAPLASPRQRGLDRHAVKRPPLSTARHLPSQNNLENIRLLLHLAMCSSAFPPFAWSRTLRRPSVCERRKVQEYGTVKLSERAG